MRFSINGAHWPVLPAMPGSQSPELDCEDGEDAGEDEPRVQLCAVL